MHLLDVDRALSRDSYYAATVDRPPPFPALDDNAACDVAIVGGGLAGLSAAIELRDRGHDVVLLEARQVGWGASGRNGGQVIAGLACDQSTIEAQLGQGAAREIWDMTLEAIALIHERCARFAIDCDWRDGFLSVAIGERKAADLRLWSDRMQQRYDHATQWIGPADLPAWIDSPRYAGAAYDSRSGHLHPLKYALGLARAASALGVRIHEGTEVNGLDLGGNPVVRTDRGTVRARHVLLAGNVYLQGVCAPLRRRIMPVGTYIVATEPLGADVADALIPCRAAVCDTNFVLDYFRNTPDHRLLFGGRVSYSTATPRDLARSMQRRIAVTFPRLQGAKIDHTWGGFVDISMNRAPDFGRLSALVTDMPAARDVYYLQGFSGHGLALSGLAGKLVAEAIDGDARRFDVFARLRHRPFPGGSLLRTPALMAATAYQRLRDLF